MSKSDDSSDTSISGLINKSGNFFLTVVVLILVVLTHFSLGGLVLFACKIAQSNILPTDIHCKPYTENPSTIKPVEVNIFNTRPPKSKETLSEKISFPYTEENTKNIILDTFRQLRESPDAFFLTNYFVTIIENLLAFDFAALNNIFAIFNYFLNESLIVMLGPILLPLVIFLLMICNQLYLIYLWFAKMSWFFKVNKNYGYEDRKPEWTNVSIFDPIGYCIAIFLIIVFIILFFFVFAMAFPFIGFFTVLWTLISLFGYKGKMNEKDIGLVSIVNKLLKYRKVTLMYVLTVLIVLSAFSTLGGIGGFVCILVAVLMVFQVVPSNLYIQEIPIHLSPLVSYDQAKKTCKIPVKPKHGFIYNFFSSLFFPQHGGQELIKEIKMAGKKLKG